MSKFIQNWRCIESGFEHGPLNMAIDEMLLLTCARSEITYPVLRFFGFMPDCVTFGISQNYKNSSALKSLSESGREITRRPTGGGIVLHDFDICYSLVVQTKLHLNFSSAEDSYEAIHQAVYAGFRHEGIEVAFAGQGKQRESDDSKCADDIVKGDLLYKEHKIAGGAQRRKDSYLLHQGFVSLKPFAATRAEYYVWFEKMRRAFQEGFKDRFGIQLNTGGLFLDEANEAIRLKNEKYGALAWNIEGFSSFSALSDVKPLTADAKSGN